MKLISIEEANDQTIRDEGIQTISEQQLNDEMLAIHYRRWYCLLVTMFIQQLILKVPGVICYLLFFYHLLNLCI